MIKTTVGMLGAAAIVFLAFSFGQVSAQTAAPTAAPAPACKTLTDEAACQGRDDCHWTAASGKRKASCRAKPRSRKKK